MDYTYMKEQLDGEYREAFEKTELYGVFSEVNTEVQDDLMMNLFDLLLTAQKEQKPVEKIIGPDMENFCKEYFQNYDWRARMKYFPQNLYRLMRVIFVLEMIDLFCMGENMDLFQARSDITPYLGGFGLSLIFTMIMDIFIRPMIFRLRIRPIFYYIGFLLVWAGAIALCVKLEDGMVLAIPMFPILLISGIYVVIYLVIRSAWRYRTYGTIRCPHSATKEFERSAQRTSWEQQMLEIMLKKYKYKNKRLKKKGKKQLTPGAFTEQVRREHKKLQNSWKWGILIFAAVIIPSVVFTSLSSTLWDTVLYALIICVIEGGIYTWIFRFEQKNNRIRQEILDTCDREGISVIEYAMRNKSVG